jgi:hypothetical protein
MVAAAQGGHGDDVQEHLGADLASGGKNRFAKAATVSLIAEPAVWRTSAITSGGYVRDRGGHERAMR